MSWKFATLVVFRARSMGSLNASFDENMLPNCRS